MIAICSMWCDIVKSVDSASDVIEGHCCTRFCEERSATPAVVSVFLFAHVARAVWRNTRTHRPLTKVQQMKLRSSFKC